MDMKTLTREEAFRLLNAGSHTLTRQERDSIIATVHGGELHLACDLFKLLLERHLELNSSLLNDIFYGGDDECKRQLMKENRQLMKEHNLVTLRKEPLLRITRVSARKLLRSIGITMENQAKLLVATRKDPDLCREVLDTLMTSNNIWVEGLDEVFDEV